MQLASLFSVKYIVCWLGKFRMAVDQLNLVLYELIDRSVISANSSNIRASTGQGHIEASLKYRSDYFY